MGMTRKTPRWTRGRWVRLGDGSYYGYELGIVARGGGWWMLTVNGNVTFHDTRDEAMEAAKAVAEGRGRRAS